MTAPTWAQNNSPGCEMDSRPTQLPLHQLAPLGKHWVLQLPPLAPLEGSSGRQACSRHGRFSGHLSLGTAPKNDSELSSTTSNNLQQHPATPTSPDKPQQSQTNLSPGQPSTTLQSHQQPPTNHGFQQHSTAPQAILKVEPPKAPKNPQRPTTTPTSPQQHPTSPSKPNNPQRTSALDSLQQPFRAINNHQQTTAFNNPQRPSTASKHSTLTCTTAPLTQTKPERPNGTSCFPPSQPP